MKIKVQLWKWQGIKMPKNKKNKYLRPITTRLSKKYKQKLFLKYISISNDEIKTVGIIKFPYSGLMK